jgi:hypothetical protein
MIDPCNGVFTNLNSILILKWQGRIWGDNLDISIFFSNSSMSDTCAFTVRTTHKIFGHAFCQWIALTMLYYMETLL